MVNPHIALGLASRNLLYYWFNYKLTGSLHSYNSK